MPLLHADERVGYYSAPNVKSRILAVRSWYPGMQQTGAEH
jgi:hypothetical protein